MHCVHASTPRFAPHALNALQPPNTPRHSQASEMFKAVQKLSKINPIKVVDMVLKSPEEQKQQLVGMLMGMARKPGLPDADM